MILDKQSNMKIPSKAEIMGKMRCIWDKYTVVYLQKNTQKYEY